MWTRMRRWCRRRRREPCAAGSPCSTCRLRPGWPANATRVNGSPCRVHLWSEPTFPGRRAPPDSRTGCYSWKPWRVDVSRRGSWRPSPPSHARAFQPSRASSMSARDRTASRHTRTIPVPATRKPCVPAPTSPRRMPRHRSRAQASHDRTRPPRYRNRNPRQTCTRPHRRPNRKVGSAKQTVAVGCSSRRARPHS